MCHSKDSKPVITCPGNAWWLQDLRVIAVDEMDALLDSYPASFGQLIDAAVSRHIPPSSTGGSAQQQLQGAPGPLPESSASEQQEPQQDQGAQDRPCEAPGIA